MSMRRVNPWMVAAFMAASAAAAAPVPDPRMHMPAWLQVDQSRRRKQKPSRLGPRAPTRPSNLRRFLRHQIEAKFLALTGRPLTGRQWVRIRKKKEAWAGFVLWLAEKEPTTRSFTPQEFGRLMTALATHRQHPRTDPLAPTHRSTGAAPSGERAA